MIDHGADDIAGRPAELRAALLALFRELIAAHDDLSSSSTAGATAKVASQSEETKPSWVAGTTNDQRARGSGMTRPDVSGAMSEGVCATHNRPSHSPHDLNGDVRCLHSTWNGNAGSIDGGTDGALHASVPAFGPQRHVSGRLSCYLSHESSSSTREAAGGAAHSSNA